MRVNPSASVCAAHTCPTWELLLPDGTFPDASFKTLQRDDILKSDILARMSSGDAKFVVGIWDATEEPGTLGEKASRRSLGRTLLSHDHGQGRRAPTNRFWRVWQIISDSGCFKPFSRMLLLLLAKAHVPILSTSCVSLWIKSSGLIH